MSEARDPLDLERLLEVEEATDWSASDLLALPHKRKARELEELRESLSGEDQLPPELTARLNQLILEEARRERRASKWWNAGHGVLVTLTFAFAMIGHATPTPPIHPLAKLIVGGAFAFVIVSRSWGRGSLV